MSYESHTGEGLQRHIDNCGYCAYLEEHGHGMVCWECNHPWRGGPCDFDRGDVPDERYKGGAVALGPCPCEESEMMTREQVEAAQVAHAEESARDAYERSEDAKYQRAKEGEGL